jgi:hypothetical protein
MKENKSQEVTEKSQENSSKNIIDSHGKIWTMPVNGSETFCKFN